LPDPLLRRETKGDFTRAYWSSDAQAFIARWDGTGLPAELVNADALRAAWREDPPDHRSALLLQAAWAAVSGAHKIQDLFNCRLQ
jgi:hypothetical protein